MPCAFDSDRVRANAHSASRAFAAQGSEALKKVAQLVLIAQELSAFLIMIGPTRASISSTTLEP